MCVNITGNAMNKCYISSLTKLVLLFEGKVAESMQFNKWLKQNKKHVTTYQHTLGEGNSRPAAAPLNTPPSPAPPSGIQESRRRRAHHRRQTAAPYEYWRVVRLGPHMALDHTLKKCKRTGSSLIHSFLGRVLFSSGSSLSQESWEWGRNTSWIGCQSISEQQEVEFREKKSILFWSLALADIFDSLHLG